MTAKDFLKRLYERPLEDPREEALDLYRTFDPFLYEKDHASARVVCLFADPERMSLVQILSLLTATLPYRGTLVEREKFGYRAKVWIQKDNPGRWERLLQGLL